VEKATPPKAEISEEAVGEEIVGEPVALAPRREGTGQLIREALDETRQLVQLEVALARVEMREEIGRAKSGAIALGIAAGGGIAAFTMFMVALALAFTASWLAALVVAGSLLLLAVAAGIVGWKALPKELLSATRARLKSDYRQLKERVA
jgi:uncharacterized membrane protein YqjE